MFDGPRKDYTRFPIGRRRRSTLSAIPEELRYNASHEWVHVDGDTATVGITDFAQHSLTDVVYVELPKKGARLESGKAFGVVESVKSVSDLFAPVSGEVLAVNEELVKKPELINDDPYGRGWMVRLRLAHRNDLTKLLDAAGYRKSIGE